MTFAKFFQRLSGVLVLVCLLIAGCSNNVKVTGTITYSDSDEPVQSGVVVFTGEKEIGRGAIRNGKYSVGLIKDGDGLPLGKYVVAANSFAIPDWALAADSIDNPNPPTQKEEIYYTKEPQEIDVSKSMTYDFVVERGKRP